MFIVIEIQYNGTTAATIATSYQTKNEANAKYHTVLAAAAVSSLPVHSAIIIDETGHLIKSEFYRHSAEEASE